MYERFLFNEKIKNLYSEINENGIGYPIKFEIINKNENAVGYCQLIKGNETYIKINIREDRLTEEVITHELLHAKRTMQGHCSGIVSLYMDSIIEKIGESLVNSFEHYLIYKKQDELNISRDIERNSIVKQMVSAKEEENNNILENIIDALIIVESKLYGYKDLYLYEDALSSKFRRGKEISDKIYNLILTTDISTPFKTRQALSKALKMLTEIANDSKISFNQLIAIGFIPSKRQLDLYMPQVFSVTNNYLNSGYTGITSNSDNQLSYLIQNPSKHITPITVRKFLIAAREPVLTRN